MKFPLDLQRDMMLAIEQSDRITGPNGEELEKILTDKGYTDFDQIAYAAKKLYEGNLVERETKIDPQGTITYFGTGNLTYKGHQILNNIRDDSVWKKTKKKIGTEFASVSMGIAVQVASAYIKQKLGFI